MTTKVITVTPETPMLEIEDLFYKQGVSFLPVINEDNVVQGVITERDLFASDRHLHIPTYIKLLKETEFIQHDNKTLPYVAEQITRTKASEVMNKKVIFASPDMDLEKLIKILAVKGTIGVAVTDHANKLVGAISRGDLIKKIGNLNLAEVPLDPDRVYRPIDEEVSYTYNDLKSRFAFVAKARANIWLTTAVVLFILGFIAGIIYIANPNF